MLKKYLLVFFISMVPLIELRGSVPVGLSGLWGNALPVVPLYIVCILGNMLPVPIIFIASLFKNRAKIYPIIRMKKYLWQLLS